MKTSASIRNHQYDILIHHNINGEIVGLEFFVDDVKQTECGDPLQSYHLSKFTSTGGTDMCEWAIYNALKANIAR